MASEKIADLRRLAPKLKEAETRLSTEIQQGTIELEELKTSISRGEIELSLIHDAFHLKFGQIEPYELENAMQAMDNLNQIEILEIELAHELDRAKQAEAEIQRISVIAPTSPTKEIDLDPLIEQERQLTEKLNSLKIKNAKKEKNLRIQESNIGSLDAEIDEMREELKRRQEHEKEVEKQNKIAEKMLSEINEVSEQIKNKNKEMKEVQSNLAKASLEIEEISDMIQDNEISYKQNIDANSKLIDMMNAIKEANKPFQDLKNQHDLFMKNATGYKQTMSDQLTQINSLIDVLKAEMEQNSE